MRRSVDRSHADAIYHTLPYVRVAAPATVSLWTFLRQPGGRIEVAPLRKSMARAMHPEICSMRVAEAAKRQRRIDTEGLARA